MNTRWKTVMWSIHDARPTVQHTTETRSTSVPVSKANDIRTSDTYDIEREKNSWTIKIRQRLSLYSLQLQSYYIHHTTIDPAYPCYVGHITVTVNQRYRKHNIPVQNISWCIFHGIRKKRSQLKERSTQFQTDIE